MKGVRHKWRQLAQQMAPEHMSTEVRSWLEAIAYLGIAARKELLKIARCQRDPASNAFLRSHLTCIKSSYTCAQDVLLLDLFECKTSSIVSGLAKELHKDIALSAVVSNLCRSAPFLNISESEAQENREASWTKEHQAAQDPDRPQVLDYGVWFSDDPKAADLPLSPYLPSAPGHNRRIRESFREWRSTMEDRILFPQLQDHRSVSRSTAEAYADQGVNARNGQMDYLVTSAMLERHYAETGVEIRGSCEMRQAWKYNDLTPRTYFAQGGRAFHASKYVRDIANSLANSFPQTGFATRFSYMDLEISDEHTSFIYDYSSFTSNLTELKYFLDELADFCGQTMVRLVDSNRGLQTVSLGSVIRVYNDTCNRECSYSVERWIDGLTAPYVHKRSGLLGVYGNIAFSTILHGLHACQLAGDDGDAKCVGDDVYASVRLSTARRKREIIEAIASVGSINRDKVRWWSYRRIEHEDGDDRTWPYCKRPFDRFQTRMILEQSLHLPILGLIASFDDGFHDIETETYPRVKNLAVQTFSLITQCRSIFPPLTVNQALHIEAYVTALYRHLGISEHGHLPYETFIVHKTEVSGLFLPRVTSGFIFSDPWDLLEQRWRSQVSPVVRLPKMTKDYEVRSMQIFQNPGVEVESCMDRALNYARQLQWVKVKRVYEERMISYEEYRSFYESLFAGELFPIYSFMLRVGSPQWLNETV